MSFHLDSIKNLMNPKAKEETPTLEEAKEQKEIVNRPGSGGGAQQKVIVEFVHEDEITRAYLAMKQGKDGLLEEGKLVKESDEPATITKMGAQIAKQEKIKLGGKTKVDLHPKTTPPNMKDTATIGMSKKGYKSVAKTTGEEIIQTGE